jgi:hypothetical protein
MNKIVYVTLILLISSTLCQNEASSITGARDYASLSGVQVYIYDKSYAFSYLSIDISNTTKLKAKLFLYTSIADLTTLSTGVYTSIGFGSSVMSGSDILLCAYEKDKTSWCKDYKGINQNITNKASITTLLSTSTLTLDSNWGNLKTMIVWNIERTMDPTPVMNGTTSAMEHMEHSHLLGFLLNMICI